MKLRLNGVLSVTVEDESLFDGQPLPVSFECEVEQATLVFEDGKVRFDFRIPAQLSLPEAEWSRALGEVLARSLLTSEDPLI